MVAPIVYDAVIIGSGPAGFTAAIYTCRSKLKTLLIECFDPPSQAAMADFIENYPGFPEGIGGFQLLEKLKNQAKNFGPDFHTGKVDSVSLEDNKEKALWRIKAGDKTYNSLAVILAVGARHKQLDVEGEERFRGKGVSYCALCDGAFFKDKDVLVVGGGNSAVSEALYLTRFASRVFLVHRRDRLRAVPILTQRAQRDKKVEFILGSVVTNIYGKDKVEEIGLKNVASGEQSRLKCNGVFVSVGYIPNTEFLAGLIDLDSSGHIITDQRMKTSKPGIFACGDCRTNSLPQVVAACGDGAEAAASTIEYVDRLKGQAYE